VDEICKWDKIKDGIEGKYTTYLKQDRVKKKEILKLMCETDNQFLDI